MSSYLIVGAGVFGASTALELSKADPSANITLIDQKPAPRPLAASYDYNKVVRTDYGDLFYMRLMLKSRQYWEERPLYKRFYHKCSLVNIDSTDLGKRIVENYAKLGEPSEAKVIKLKELKTYFSGLFEDADESDIHDCYVNFRCGWAEAAPALQAVVDAAVNNGVQYVEASISRLLFDDGACIGVQSSDGKTLKASRIILCTGAGTAKLIADSAPTRLDLQVKGRIVAAAVISGTVKLTPAQAQKYQNVPIWIHSVGKTVGETMPVTPGNILKFTRDLSFKNTQLHSASGQMISMPPDKPDQDQYLIPKGLRNEIDAVRKGIFGKRAEDLQIDGYRICWDGITPNQDFIISPHPCCANLYIATGGSFHGWKFLPILGEYVVQMLQGTLEPEMERRWAWDRDNKGAAQGGLVPHRELSDILPKDTIQSPPYDI